MTVLVFGGIVIDYSCKTESVKENANLVDEYSSSLGGMGYNTAYATAQLGAETELISAVGDDFKESYADAPEKLNLTLHRSMDAQSSRCFLFHDKSGKEEIYFYRGAYHHLNHDACIAALDSVDLVHFAGVMLPFLDIMSESKRLGKKICFNPGYDLHHYDSKSQLIQGMIGLCDILIMNEEEFKALKLDAEKIAIGKEVVIITKGGKGCDIYVKGSKSSVGCFKVKNSSPFGAGDAFTGGLLAALETKIGLNEAIKIASAAGSFAVEERATRPKISWAKVSQRARKIQ
jgi:sugar/nucleoside kinase (ribokinase family)